MFVTLPSASIVVVSLVSENGANLLSIKVVAALVSPLGAISVNVMEK